MTVNVNGRAPSLGRPRHLLHVFPSFSVGGAQIRFAQLANAHGARYRHTVVALDGRTEMGTAVAPSVDWTVLRLENFDKRAGLRNVALFRHMLGVIKPDLVVTYNWGAIEWCIADRLTPIVPHIHIEDGFGKEERDRQLFRRAFTRRLALSGTHTRVIVPSRVLESIATNAWCLPKRNILYIPNGVDCSRFTLRGEGPQNPSDPIVIGTVASLRPEKRLDLLIHAFVAASKARPNRSLALMIVGDGPDRPNLENEAARVPLGATIAFTGMTNTPEEKLREMDIFALSSDTEQMPLSVLEAMACGLPVASRAVGDVANMVSEPNKPFVVAKNDSAAFLRALLSLIDDADARHRIGTANRSEAVARFSFDAMVARYADLFG